MAFSLDREGASRRLGVSSRTIDRHIQAGRIRTRRIGKKMFLEEDDIETLRMTDPARREEDYVVIMDRIIWRLLRYSVSMKMLDDSLQIRMLRYRIFHINLERLRLSSQTLFLYSNIRRQHFCSKVQNQKVILMQKY